MSTAVKARSIVGSLVVAVAACESTGKLAAPSVTASSRSAPTLVELAPSDPEAGPPPAASSDASVPATPLGLDVEALTAGMSPYAKSRLDTGYRALRDEEYAAAVTALPEVVILAPENVEARYQAFRATALSGDLAAVPTLWRALIARDYVGYAGRLKDGSETKRLRESPHCPRIEGITAEVGLAYRANLAADQVFLTSTWPGSTRPANRDDARRLEVDAEVYHSDEDHRRVRRLTATGGRVLAIHRDDERNRLSLLLARALERREVGITIVEPEAALLSLDTLELSGRVAIAAAVPWVQMCVSPRGAPLWSVPAYEGSAVIGARALTLDAAGTALVAADECCGEAVARTIARGGAVEHHPPGLKPAP